MAGTCTVTRDDKGIVAKWQGDWVADGAGDATQTMNLCGELNRFVTVPSDILVPLDNYNVTLLDANGMDVLQGLGLLRDQTNIEQDLPNLNGVPISVEGVHTLTVDTAGDSNAGQFTIYLRQTDPVVHRG